MGHSKVLVTKQMLPYVTAYVTTNVVEELGETEPRKSFSGQCGQV